MKVSVKTLDQKQFKIEIEDDFTIEQIKSAIMKEKDNDPNLDPKISKLIWKGKILKNDQVAKNCNIDEKGFFVIMPGKGKSQPKKPEPETPRTSKPKEEKKPEPSKKEDNQSSTGTDEAANTSAAPVTPVAAGNAATGTSTPVAATAATPPAANPASAAPQIPIDPQEILNNIHVSDDLISTVSGFGFPADRAKLALQIANNNPDVAVELLFSNDLDNAVENFKRQLTQQASRLAGQLTGTGNSNSSSNPQPTGNNADNNAAVEAEINRQIDNSTNPLAYLTENPTFQRMLQVIGENPDVLPQVLQQISQGNPDLFQQISNNHEAFLSLVNNAQSARTSGASGNSGNASGTGGASAAPQGQARQNADGRIEMRVTQQEREAINRLMALGVSEIEAVQAYMACDKNEELAANFLFDQM